MISQLCADLRGIYEYEIEHGNAVLRVDEPAGTECPYAVIFAENLRICGTVGTGKIPTVVRYWESRDPHYPAEVGFVCTEHRHVVAGPVVD
jgi:hypothetical protein